MTVQRAAESLTGIPKVVFTALEFMGGVPKECLNSLQILIPVGSDKGRVFLKCTKLMQKIPVYKMAYVKFPGTIFVALFLTNIIFLAAIFIHRF